MQDALTAQDAPQAPERDSNKSQIRRVNSHQFGEITISPDQVFQFEEGLFGFELFRDFVLISDPQTDPLKWLLSLDDPTIGFPVLNPLIIDLSYQVSREFRGDNFVPMVVVTLANSNRTMSANMKAPIILDMEAQAGKQIILNSERYSTDYVFGDAPTAMSTTD